MTRRRLRPPPYGWSTQMPADPVHVLPAGSLTEIPHALVGGPVGHLTGDGPCQDCGGPNIVWFTDSPLWNEVMPGDDITRVLCVHCFVGRAERLVDVSGWHLTAELRA